MGQIIMWVSFFSDKWRKLVKRMGRWRFDSSRKNQCEHALCVGIKVKEHGISEGWEFIIKDERQQEIEAEGAGLRKWGRGYKFW